jgi:hypothetical protein
MQRLGYVPSAWIGLMHGPGGVSQPRGVADQRDVQSGFERRLNPRTSSTAAGEVADTALAFVQRVLV